MICNTCNKKNNEDANFCSRCGHTFNKKNKCPICLEVKKTTIIICGHTICTECINKSYNIKQECPLCRIKINKCEKCESFRVYENEEKKECLECKYIIKKIQKDNKRILCIDCKSSRVLFNHSNDNWSCMDCFTNFKIKDKNAIVDNIPFNTTKICSLCCSNDIDYTDGIKCLNCENENVKLKHITLEEYSRLRIKSKDEVSKKMEKLYCCKVCESDNICKIVNLNDPLEEIYFCKKCNKSNLGIKEIKI